MKRHRHVFLIFLLENMFGVGNQYQPLSNHLVPSPGSGCTPTWCATRPGVSTPSRLAARILRDRAVPTFAKTKPWKNQGLYLWRLECLWNDAPCEKAVAIYHWYTYIYILIFLYRLQKNLGQALNIGEEIGKGRFKHARNLERFSWFLDLGIECGGDCWSFWGKSRHFEGERTEGWWWGEIEVLTWSHWAPLVLFDVSHQECLCHIVFAPMVMWHRRLIVILWEPCKSYAKRGPTLTSHPLNLLFGEWGGDPLCKGQAGMYHWIAGKIKQAPKFNVIWKWQRMEY